MRTHVWEFDTSLLTTLSIGNLVSRPHLAHRSLHVILHESNHPHWGWFGIWDREYYIVYQIAKLLSCDMTQLIRE